MCDSVYLIFSFCSGPLGPCKCFKIKSIVSRHAVFVILCEQFAKVQLQNLNCNKKCNRGDEVHFTLVPSGSGEWLHCKVLTVKPVSLFIFVLNLMWTYCSMLLSSRHFKCMHLLKMYSVLKTWPVEWGGLTAKERSDCGRSLSALFSLLSVARLRHGSVTISNVSAPFLCQHTQSFCAFSLFLLFFTCFLEKNKMLVLI